MACLVLMEIKGDGTIFVYNLGKDYGQYGAHAQ